ncbi:hypothetical protein VNO78_11187 [Psophocarpus tetragonolobus]|uniref:urease n=1 Tax=Psophocarpus tetragonolobus TaxID=3891 RepID=A0AAN9SKZ5_PSOTE
MKLSPREVEKLCLHNAGYLAQKRLARGLRFNYIEAVALITTEIMEFARDGEETVAQLMCTGKHLGRRHVLPQVPRLLKAVHVPSLDKFAIKGDNRILGEIIYEDGCLTLNPGRKAVILKVVNKGDRPIQVGSHYYFIEVNPYLTFDRRKAYGMRLIIASGTAVRFEVQFYVVTSRGYKSVKLVRIGGNKVIRGGNGITDGPVNETNHRAAMEVVCSRGFGHKEEEDASEGITKEDSDCPFTTIIPREEYANKYGPTSGGKIRLGDTDLFAKMEKDFALYGDERVNGGGKVLRDGMGQSCGYPPAISLDTVMTNAVIIDYSGIIKADLGIKDGHIVSIGNAGNPDIMDGITTLVGGGTGPAAGTRATTCTPALSQMKLMLQSTDELPLNFGFTGKVCWSSSKPDELHEIIRPGAMGLKLHEDWGSTPAAIDNFLTINIHTDTLNEAGFVEHNIAAFIGRTIHTYHSEGAGGGYAPDIIKVCGMKNAVPSSTNATLPLTANTIDEHLDMLLISRTWQTANKMKVQRGPLQPGESDNDNFRIKRYIAKYTINPAIANGFSQYVGSVEVYIHDVEMFSVGKLAESRDMEAIFFRGKTRNGDQRFIVAWADTGDPNASIPTPESAALDLRVNDSYGLNKRVEAVGNVRKLKYALS